MQQGMKGTGQMLIAGRYTRRFLGWLVSLWIGALVVTSLADAQSPAELTEMFRYKRDVALVESAKRHYDLGKWCWKNELLSQSTSEVLYALEISDQRHKPSKTALSGRP